VPMGTTLGALIDKAGGLPEGRRLQAVLLGGAAGSFVTEKQLDVPLSFEGTRSIGATLGSGAVMVLDDTADLSSILLRIAAFFRHESCGQCVPCRVGTKRQEEILQRVLSSRNGNSHEAGMNIQTDSERVRHSRRVVLEFLGSSVDMSLTAPEVHGWMKRYGADVNRFGPAAATVEQPVMVDNELYVRDYSRCILCYKCVEACGVDAQNTFALGVAGRGFDAHISTEFTTPLPESACVYCGNCIGVCPTGALMFKSEYDMRQAGTWDESKQTVTETVCAYCGVGCMLELHVQDNSIVKVTSPLD